MILFLAAAATAIGVTGHPVEIGKDNIEIAEGRKLVRLDLKQASSGGNTWDLYLNRDRMHSVLNTKEFPGLTPVRFSQELREMGADSGWPTVYFPYPVFGNCSLAYTQGDNWRSMPRALMTFAVPLMRDMVRMYVSNQFWVYPANEDTPPLGKHGDVFASVTPYWLVTQGKSYSDLPYLKAALIASSSLDGEVKKEVVRRGLLAPLLQTLLRHSLHAVKTEDDYCSAKAHPVAFPAGGLDLNRLAASAAKLKLEEVPPLSALSVVQPQLATAGADGTNRVNEILFSTAFAWAITLRAPVKERVFYLSARGAKEYRFFQTHGDAKAVKIMKILDDSYKVTIDAEGVNSTNRVDIAVVGRSPGTMWGAPSFLSVSRMVPATPGAYVDPLLKAK